VSRIDEEVLAVRREAGLFELADRGLLEIAGSDARRWLNGMLTNDVASLAEGPERSGCPALVLTNKGRIVADVQVLLVPPAFWLETAQAAVPDLLERLSKLVIADDVRLTEKTGEVVRFGLEGPGSRAVLERVLGTPLALAPGACAQAVIAGATILIARYGWSGEDAYQLFVPCASAASVHERLLALLPGGAATPCSAAALEVLRIEAGRPRLFAELSQEVLPPEARLEGSISYTKGCYTGQEIVARLRSRGHVNHLLVGLRFEAGALPARGGALHTGGSTVGEITSAAQSPLAGAIALAFVRVGHDAPGTQLEVAGARARVASLPFVAPSEPAP
jgi:folate-binding protein YgfZ